MIVFQKLFPGAARTELESQLQRAVKVSAKGKREAQDGLGALPLLGPGRQLCAAPLALICMLYRSSVPADCCTSPGMEPPKAPKCSFAIPPSGTEKSRRAVLQTPCEDSTAGTDAAITAALLAYYTSAQVDALLGDYRTGTAQGAETTSHHGRAAGLLHRGASGRAVGRLPHGERAGHADAGRHRGRAAGLPDGPGPGRVHHQPNHLGAGGAPLSRRPGHGDGLEHRRRAAQLLHHRTSRRPPRRQARSHGGGLCAAVRFPDDGGADKVVAAIGEQILGPTDVSLSNWTVRPSSGCSVVLATHTAGVSVDGYTLTLAANPWNIVRTYNLTPGRELLFACRYRLGTASNFVVYMSEADNVYDPLYGSFAGDQGAWSTAKMYFTVPPNGVAKLHFGAHFQAPGLPNQTAGTVDVYGLQILDATLEAGNTAEEDAAASALLLKHEFLDGGADDVTLATLHEVLLEPTLTTLGNFLVRSNSQSSVASASFTVGGFQLEGYAMTLSAFAWNIVRTYTLTPGRRYSFGCRYRLGTASNLVMYVSAADNDYVGVTGTFLGTPLAACSSPPSSSSGRDRPRSLRCWSR